MARQDYQKKGKVGTGALSALLFLSFAHVGHAQSTPPTAVKTSDVPPAPAAVVKTSDVPAVTVKTPNTPAAAPATPGTKPTVPSPTGLPALLNFTTWNNSLMTVNLLMDGKIQQCVVDSGLSASTITPELADTLKLAALPSKVTVASLNETRTVPETELKNLKFNLLTITGLHAGIVDASELYLGAAQYDAPGIWLGTPFLAAYQVTFDFTAHTILLERPNAPLPKGKGAVTLPIEVHDGHIFTKVSIPKAGSFSALIDTGAMGTLIPSAIAAKLKGVPTKTFDIKRPGGKQVKACLVMLPKMQAGRLEQEQVPALYFEKPKDAPVNANQTVKQADQVDQTVDHTLAVLGHDFLRHYKVTLNFTRNKMVLIPPPLPNEDDGSLANANSGKRSGTGNGSNSPSSSNNSTPALMPASKGRTHF